MSLEVILEGLTFAKKVVPVAEATFAALGPVAENEKEDVKAAVAAIGKSFLDLKGNFAVLEAVVKASLNA